MVIMYSAFSGLWNAMIYPFLNMTIKGAIWYQGEANASKHNSNIVPKPVVHPMVRAVTAGCNIV